MSQATQKENRNAQAIWLAKVLLKRCSGLDLYTTRVARRVIDRNWAYQFELKTLERAVDQYNAFGDEGVAVEDY